VFVKDGKTKTEKSIPFFKKEAKDLLSVLRKKVPQLENKNVFFSIKNQNDTGNDDENNKIVIVKTRILEEIKQNPGINAIKLHKNLQTKQSIRTIKRRLKELTDSGLIQFQGADKTGGYYITGKRCLC